ncbi:MAG: hypothetical protein K6F34_01325 [Lachnospiraceae bacterium]|nr:hypothetical protein [Lachnospiraceae bacterium]
MNEKNTRKYIAVVIYILLTAALLIYFNKKRSEEYSYSYDFNRFSLDAGTRPEDGSYLSIDESSGFSNVFSASPGTQLRSGDYLLSIDYSSDSDNTVHYAANSNTEDYVTLPAGQDNITVPFSVWPSSDNFRIWLIYKGAGTLTINNISLSSSRPIYTDYEYFMLVTVLIALLLPVLITILKKHFKFGREQWIISGILSTVCILVSFPAFYDHIWMGTDTRPHLMRIDGVSTAITAHRIPTVIYSNYCNDYGELSCIYPDKFLYLPGLLRKFGVSLLASHGTMLIIINAAALLIMFFCTRLITGSAKASLISAVIYCFFPYRMYVMYGGGQAFGMGLSMLFFPVIFASMYDIFFLKGKRWYLLSIGVTGLLFSHILSLALGIIICTITALFCIIISIVKRHERNIREPLLSIIKAALLTAVLGLSTIVPFLYYYGSGLNTKSMKLDFFASFKPLISDLISGNGVYHLILLAVCILLVVIKKAGKHIYCRYLLIAGFVLYFMSTKLFPWGLIKKIGFIADKLGMFQFAERFMLAGTAAISLGIGMLISDMMQASKASSADAKDAPSSAFRINPAMTALMIFCVIAGVYTAYQQTSACDISVYDRATGDIYYKQIGYLPAGSKVEYYQSNVPNCYDWDSVNNIAYIKNGTSIHYEYTCLTDDNYMEFPLFYYKGYEAHDANGNPLPIMISDHNRITIGLVKSNEPQVIDIEFKMHPAFRVCALISLIGLLGLITFPFRPFRRRA